MRFGKKRGLSDVVSTVLIILLVLAAVAIIGAVVLRGIGTAGTKITSQTACFDLDIKPTACVKVNSAGGLATPTTANVTVARGAGGSDQTLTNVTFVFENADGTTQVRGVIASDLGALSSKRYGPTTTPNFNPALTVAPVRVAVAGVISVDGKDFQCDPSTVKVICQ